MIVALDHANDARRTVATDASRAASKIITAEVVACKRNAQLSLIHIFERKAAAPLLKDVDTTGLTSAQIDAMLFSNGSTSSTNVQAADGLQITDITNSLLLVRQGGVWYKTSTLTPV